MHTHTLPEEGGQTLYCPKECQLPNSNDLFELNIWLKAKKKVKRVFRHSYEKGDRVPINITLEELLEVVEEAPEVMTRFDTSTDYRKHDCMRAVRAVTGWGLKASKDFVEEVARLKGIICISDFKGW